jgi:hypothetical protein
MAANEEDPKKAAALIKEIIELPGGRDESAPARKTSKPSK